MALEGFSRILIAADVKPQVALKLPHIVWSRDDIPKYLSDPNRLGEVLRGYVAWEEQHPEIKLPHNPDMELRKEQARYERQGTKTGKYFFSGFDTLTRDLDDEFRVYGAKSGKIKYSINYKTDSAGRRTTGFENTPAAKRNIIFLGCSFTFGEGVPDASTFPAVVGRSLKDSRIYNLGVPGSSPSYRLMALKKNKKLLEGIDPTLPTYIIITFIDDHMRRVFGTSLQLHNVKTHYEDAPDFYIGNHKLLMHPDFYQRHKALRVLNKIYSLSGFSQLTRIEFPLIRKDQFELVARIVSEMKNEIATVLPQTREIYLAAFPGQNYYIKRMRPHLGKAGVKTLDYSGINFLKLLGRHFHLDHDGHPSAKTYDLYGFLLSADLKKDLGL